MFLGNYDSSNALMEEQELTLSFNMGIGNGWNGFSIMLENNTLILHKFPEN